MPSRTRAPRSANHPAGRMKAAAPQGKWRARDDKFKGGEFKISATVPSCFVGFLGGCLFVCLVGFGVFF